MSKQAKFTNVYTGLLAGAVSGWLLSKLLSKPKHPNATVMGSSPPWLMPDNSYIREGSRVTITRYGITRNATVSDLSGPQVVLTYDDDGSPTNADSLGQLKLISY